MYHETSPGLGVSPAWRELRNVLSCPVLNNANLIKGMGSFCGQGEACGAEIV